MRNYVNILALLSFVTSLAIGQVLFKSVGLSIRGQPLAAALAIVVRQPALYAALVLYAAATALWIWILSRIPLSQASPWISLQIVTVPLLGWSIFGESVGPMFWLGIGLVVAGVVVTQYSLGHS